MNIDHHEAARGVTELYRFFDIDRRLLYIGVSLSAVLRLRGHVHKSPWFDQVAYITIERYETRLMALAAEKSAVRAERPRYNTMLTGRRMKEPPLPLEPLAVRLRRRLELEKRIAATPEDLTTDPVDLPPLI
jgi:hypothetical protein